MKQIPSVLGLAMASMTLVALACGSSGGTGGSGGSGSGGSTGAGGSTSNVDSGTSSCPARPDLIVDGGPTCDNVVNSATAIPFTALTGTAPTPAGGTVLDGLYESTKTGAYGSTNSGGRRITFVITKDAAGARHMLWNGEVLDAAGANVTSSFKADATITIAGTQITNSSVNCGAPSPPPLPATFDYTVSGSDLILSLASTGAATTYTRRGCAP